MAQSANTGEASGSSQRGLVSVVMPVYNGEALVSDAVQSLLAQTCTQLELIVIDDASTDGTAEVLRSFDDPRVRVLRNEKNIGVTKSRNRGHRLVRGEFIAVHDHDDVSSPERLEKQIAFLRASPEHVAASCGFVLRRAEAPPTMGRQPGTGLGIRWKLLFRTAMQHPGLLVRTDAMRKVGGYDESFAYASDYDLECRLARVGKLHNLAEPLVTVHRRAEGITESKTLQQRQTLRVVSAREIGRLLGIEPVEARLQALADVVLPQGGVPRACDAREAMVLSLRIARRFERVHACPGFLSDKLGWILKEHVKFALLGLLRGKFGEAALRGWIALELAASGLIERPLRLLVRAALPHLSFCRGRDPRTGEEARE